MAFVNPNKTYRVEHKAFKTGEWYKKLVTHNYATACSVANSAYGRAGRVIDEDTGEILREYKEDASMKAINGNVSQFFR